VLCLDEPDLFFKLLKLIPIIQEINRKHSEALNTIKMSETSSGQNFNCNNPIKAIQQQQQQKCVTNESQITTNQPYISSGVISAAKLDDRNRSYI
jgi:hypothetical protein